MNELIKVVTKDNKQTVDARELFEFLKVRDRFDQWIKRKIEKYDFVENRDFCTILCGSTGGRPSTDYELSINMAKELAMLENNEQGRQARKYFISCEEKLIEESVKNVMPHNYIESLERLLESEKQKESLRIELDKSKQFVSIKRLGVINNLPWQRFSWRLLKAEAQDGEIVDIFDANYGSVKAYHVDLVKRVYPDMEVTEHA